jgi:hypothetical protein
VQACCASSNAFISAPLYHDVCSVASDKDDVFAAGEAGRRTAVVSTMRALLLQALYGLKQTHSMTKRCVENVSDLIIWIQRLTLSRLGLTALASVSSGLPSLCLKGARVNAHGRKQCVNVSFPCVVAYCWRPCSPLLRRHVACLCTAQTFGSLATVHDVAINCRDLPFDPPREAWQVRFADPMGAWVRIVQDYEASGACFTLLTSLLFLACCSLRLTCAFVLILFACRLCHCRRKRRMVEICIRRDAASRRTCS